MPEQKQLDRILVVDDEPLVSDIIARCLEAEGFDCVIADCAEAALELIDQSVYSLVISDMMMPGKSGLELLSIIKKQETDIAVIMVTAVDDRKTAIKALQLGAYGYVIKPFDLNEIMISVVNALERRRLAIQSREYETRLENDVRKRTAEIRLREEEICMRLISACEYRDEETGSHIRRIGLYAAVMAEALEWDKRAVDEIRLAASMHDIGKIGLSDNILLKNGKLTPKEFEIVKRHTLIGAEILSGSDISLLKMAKDIALSHQEKWNGTGYPHGLGGEEIPESARIVTIIDVYDALVHKRVYRPAIPEDEALGMIEQGRGEHFDPQLYDLFIKILPQLRDIRMKVRDPLEE
ncbi:MAG: response regulator [Deltaproteobacteria bacterium]|nr:response regulator [Deltaproteobacteria bacterium]